MGIIIAASGIYFATQVPEWTKDYESQHTAEVADDFSELKSLIDGIVLKQGESELAGGTIPVKMAPDKVPIFGMSPPGSNLIFNPEDEKIELVVPIEEGGEVGTKAWEQNATTGFPYIDAEHVDNSSNEVKLAKLTPEGNLILEPGDTIQLGGEHSYDQVIIKNNAILYVSHVTGFLKIHANNITVDSGSNITADRVGYLGGTTDRIGFGPSYGELGSGGSGGGGAGYGASGGDGGDNPGSGGGDYGDATSVSIEIGSGGGGGTGNAGGGSGGSGGGAIWLDAEEIYIFGIVSGNGDYGLPGTKSNDGGGGGGSGGGILIRGKNVTISGTLSAKGGDGGDSGGGTGGDGGGGAGGRIKIFYDTLDESGAIYEMNGGAGGGSGSIHKDTITYTSSITHYSSGHLVSEIFNTTSESTCYGEMTWDATLNDQTIVMKVRTDMFEDMRASPDWDYCPAVSNGQDISELSSVSDGHCFIQYCAELATDDTATTPVLHEVRINYSLSAESPTVANSSGSIKFQSNYLYYPNQEIVYEHGAVIKWQPEDERGFILHEPSIDIPVWDGSPAIEISTVDLTGGNYSYSGATTTSVKNVFKEYNLLADGLKYPNLTINVTTDYPSVWEEWFNKELEEKGWDVSFYDVSVTAKNVAVEFYGQGDGVKLYLEKTAVEVKI